MRLVLVQILVHETDLSFSGGTELASNLSGRFWAASCLCKYVCALGFESECSKHAFQDVELRSRSLVEQVTLKQNRNDVKDAVLPNMLPILSTPHLATLCPWVASAEARQLAPQFGC